MTFRDLAPGVPALPAPLRGLSDNPVWDLRLGLLVIAGFTLAFAAWASLAPLDAAATAAGHISVAGHDQLVATRDGGVVAEVDVVEGQHVRAGQVLARLATSSAGADVSALNAELISLQAQRARLLAELNQSAQITWPVSFSKLSGDDLATAQTAMHVQQLEFEADQGESAAQASAAVSAARGLQEQIAGGRGEMVSNEREQELLNQQLAGVEGLAAKGFAPMNSVRALQRSAAELSGAHDQIRANIAQYREQVAQTQLSLRGARKQRIEAVANALRQTEDDLSTLLPKLAQARTELERGTLRARTDGVVTGLSVFAAGEVVAAGGRLMEIVPTKPKLVIDAKIAANDTRDVHVGQAAQVRLLSLGSGDDPVLNGVLTNLSADSFTDERTGQSYYTAQVTVPQSEVKRLGHAAAGQDVLRPGLPVEVMVDLQARTAFDYLFEPLTQSLWNAFRQR